MIEKLNILINAYKEVIKHTIEDRDATDNEFLKGYCQGVIMSLQTVIMDLEKIINKTKKS